MRKCWQDSVRVQAVAFYAFCYGNSADDIALACGINRRTVFKWMTAYDWKGLRDLYWEQFQGFTEDQGDQITAAYSALIPNQFFSKGTGHA